jgi:hypothetical protein
LAEGALLWGQSGLGSGKRLWSIEEGVGDEVIDLNITGGNLTNLQVIDGGVTQATVAPAGEWAEQTPYKSVAAWALNSIGLSTRGAAEITDTAATIPTVDRIRICARTGGGTPAIYFIKNLRYYPTRKSAAELAVLSA